MDENVVKAPLTNSERLLRYWLPVALMLTLMFLFSTDFFSGENTKRVIEWVMRLFWKDENAPDLKETNFLIRKFAHFFEYAVLASLLFRAFRADSRLRWRLSWAAASFGVVVGWSLLDEFHQTFTKTRGASIYDSMLDSSGGLFALLVIAIISHLRQRQRRSIY